MIKFILILKKAEYARFFLDLNLIVLHNTMSRKLLFMWNFVTKLFKYSLGILAFGIGLLMMSFSYLKDKITGSKKEEELGTDKGQQNGVNLENIAEKPQDRIYNLSKPEEQNPNLSKPKEQNPNFLLK